MDQDYHPMNFKSVFCCCCIKYGYPSRMHIDHHWRINVNSILMKTMSLRSSGMIQLALLSLIASCVKEEVPPSKK